MEGSTVDFGKFLRKARLNAGYKTQKQLAEVSKVSQTTLSRIEAGTQTPSPETLKALSAHLRPYTYGELLDKAGYFKELREPLIDFFDSHEILDNRIEKEISNYSIGDRFDSLIEKYLVLELEPLFESENVAVELTPNGIRKALKELDPDIDFKNAIVRAFEHIKSIQFRSFMRGDMDQVEEPKVSDLSESEILTIAAHQVGHEGDLTEEQLERIKLAMKVALERYDK